MHCRSTSPPPEDSRKCTMARLPCKAAIQSCDCPAALTCSCCPWGGGIAAPQPSSSPWILCAGPQHHSATCQWVGRSNQGLLVRGSLSHLSLLLQRQPAQEWL